MKNDNLPVSWVRWRRRRLGQLVAEGLGHVAWEVAKGEAKARHRISLAIGSNRAREAKLICLGEGSALRFALAGSMTGLSAAEVSRLEELGSKVALSAA